MERPFPAYKGIDPYVFVSYAHADAAQVYPELIRLRDEGFNIWYDEGIDPGSTWRDEIALALTQCRAFVYFVTPRSANSANCQKEVNFCLSRERKIIAVHLEPTELPIGLELSLSDMQAIMRVELAEAAYRGKLNDSLRALLPTTVKPIDITPTLTAAPKPDERSIAVLPLENRSADKENEYLSDGISEELIRGLHHVEGLRVASQLSSFVFKNQVLDVKTIGQKLNVENILSGSVQKSGSRIRVSVLLSRVSDGTTLWSERYDGSIEDIFELQDEVAAKVVEALRLELGGEVPKPTLQIGTSSIEAYNEYLLGQYSYRDFTRQGDENTIAHWERATQLDPGFGRAYAALAMVYDRYLYFEGARTEENVGRGLAAVAAGRKTSYRPRIPWDVRELGIKGDERPPVSELAYICERLRRGDETWMPFAYFDISVQLMLGRLFRGSLEYAAHYIDQVGHLNEFDRIIEERIRQTYSCLGQFDRTIEMWSELIQSRSDPDPLWVGERALLYSRTGQYKKAESDLERINRIWPRNFAQFYHLYWLRELDTARAYFGWLEKRKNFNPGFKVWGCLLLGEIDRAMDHLELIAQGGSPHMLIATFDRIIPRSIAEEVEQHPQFIEICGRLGIGPAVRDEMREIVNDVSSITGITVQLDEAY